MQIKQCQNAKILTSLIQNWKETCNDMTFGFIVDVERTIEHLDNIIKRPGTIIFTLINDKEEAVGMLGVVISKSPISEDWIANEHFWYVRPEHRNGGIRLLKTAIQWAQKQGCSHFTSTASMLASDLHDKVCKLYERMDMKKYETTYISILGE